MVDARSVSSDAPAGRLGTFAGVFTPSVLTILGIILFLRLGFVVGSAGLWGALGIIAIANGISILTSISLAAIATNLRVRGGGDYYLISRTLGPSFGGALGLVLFLAQSVSIAFYAIGFGEAVTALVPDAPAGLPQVVAGSAVAALFVLAWAGADWATRFQYAIMAILLASLVVFLGSGFARFDPELLQANQGPASDLPFWAIFAVFFPAVTGFTQGVSMSGDLRDPGKSLPRGTFAAVGISAVVYFGVAIVFAGTVAGTELVADYSAMRRVSAVPWLIDAGVISATLSSALASFLGAPRILQSLAKDRIFPWLTPFEKGAPASGNPRRGVALSAVIAFAVIGAGNLNAIASIVSMFFLISYGLLNYATYYEARANSPSFRPRFRFFHARLSLIGALGCLGAMLALDWTAGVVALSVLFAIYQYLRRTHRYGRFADSTRSADFQVVRGKLLGMPEDLEHPRDWRPVLLAFSDDPEHRERILRFAAWVEGGSGMTTAMRIVPADGPGLLRRRLEVEKELRADIRERELSAFARAVVAPDPEGALPGILQGFGLGAIRANTVISNHHAGADPERAAHYARQLRVALRCGLHVILLAGNARPRPTSSDEAAPGRIDVWFRGRASSRLMLLLAYLMTRTADWEDATLRVFAPRRKDGDAEEQLAELVEFLEEVRIPAEAELVDAFTADAVVERSRGADVVYLPFRLRAGVEGTFEGDLEGVLVELPCVALVLAAQDVELDATPDEGPQAEIAETVDAAQRSQMRATRAGAEAERARVAVEDLRAQIESALAEDDEDELVDELRRSLESAQRAAEHLERRALRARAKAEHAEREAEEARGGSGEAR